MVYHAIPRCADVGRRGLNASESAKRSAGDEENGTVEGVGGGGRRGRESICDENKTERKRVKRSEEGPREMNGVGDRGKTTIRGAEWQGGKGSRDARRLAGVHARPERESGIEQRVRVKERIEIS